MQAATVLRNIWMYAFLAKKRLLVLGLYLLMSFYYRQGLPDCVRKILVANSILLIIVLFRPSILLKFESITLVLFLFWISKSGNGKDPKEVCTDSSGKLFLKANVYINEFFFNLFNLYVLFFILRSIFRPPTPSDNDEQNPVPTQTLTNGLSQREIDELQIEYFEIPQNKANQGSEGRENTDVCSICLGGFVPLQRIHKIAFCNHTFHEDCIKEWLKLQAICPCCRANVRLAPEVLPPANLGATSTNVAPLLFNNSAQGPNSEYNNTDPEVLNNSASFEISLNFLGHDLPLSEDIRSEHQALNNQLSNSEAGLD